MIRTLDGELAPVEKKKVSRQTPGMHPLAQLSTYSGLWPVKHAHAKIPKTKSAIFSNAAKPVISVVASPWVKCKGRYPRSVALAAGDQSRIGH
jgi:hypothetical protein